VFVDGDYDEKASMCFSSIKEKPEIFQIRVYSKNPIKEKDGIICTNCEWNCLDSFMRLDFATYIQNASSNGALFVFLVKDPDTIRKLFSNWLLKRFPYKNICVYATKDREDAVNYIYRQ